MTKTSIACVTKRRNPLPPAFRMSRVNLQVNTRCRLGILAALLMAACGGSIRGMAQSVPTVTTVAAMSGGSVVSTVVSGSAVTLTATVTAGGAAVTSGAVNFCDASATYCTDIHLLATSQLTSAGTASWMFIPGVGSHSYKAIFVGTTMGGSGDAGSTSGAVGLTVTGLYAPTTGLSAVGSAGNYTLSAQVGGAGASVPTGTVSFLDTSNGNAVLGTAILGSPTAGLSLLNVSNPSSGLTPTSVAVRDFNGDGIPDLAVANFGSGTVTILLGTGNGMFTPATNGTVTVGAEPSSVASGDFNGDGIADLAVTNYGSGTVTILLGTGNGTFTPASNSPLVGSGPNSVVVGDFNGDGIADLAVANTSGNGVTILLGNGNGTFTPASGSPVQAGNGPVSVAEGDFNGDLIPDLAVANASDGTVTILLGNGDGTFTPAANNPVSAGSEPSSVAVGDFNGDGVADLAVTNYGGESVTILLGNGNGTFTSATNSPVTVGNGPSSVVVGDFNGDGIPDLAVANYGANSLTVLFGQREWNVYGYRIELAHWGRPWLPCGGRLQRRRPSGSGSRERRQQHGDCIAVCDAERLCNRGHHCVAVNFRRASGGGKLCGRQQLCIRYLEQCGIERNLSEFRRDASSRQWHPEPHSSRRWAFKSEYPHRQRADLRRGG